MRPMTPALVLMSILWILGGSFFLSKLFCPATAAAGAATTSNLSLIDGDFKATSTGNYRFAKDAASITIAGDAKKNYFEKIANYLSANSGKMLALTGAYGSGEVNKTDFGNLGIARAEAVKEVLVENGAKTDQITTSGIEKSNLGFIDKKLYNSVDFEFVADKSAAASTQANLNFDESKTVYFKGDEAGFAEDDPKLLEIIDYLAAYITTNPDALIIVNGYTDNQGSSSQKMKIAKQRAERIRRIIRDSKGGDLFKSKRVIAKAVGPQDPQADNETTEGMAINNRVTIVVE